MVNITKRFNPRDKQSPELYPGAQSGIWAVTMHPNNYYSDAEGGGAVYLQAELVQAPGINEGYPPQTNPHAKLEDYTDKQGQSKVRPGGVRYTLGQYEKIVDTAKSTGNFLEGTNAQGEQDGRTISLVKGEMMFKRSKDGSSITPVLNTSTLQPVTEMRITPEFQRQQIEVQRYVNAVNRDIKENLNNNPNMSFAQAVDNATADLDPQQDTEVYAANRMRDLGQRALQYEQSLQNQQQQQTDNAPQAVQPEANGGGAQDGRVSMQERLQQINSNQAQQSSQPQQDGPSM